MAVAAGVDQLETELGILDITLLSAKGLPKMDVLGLADPYCVMKLVNEDGKEGKILYKTKFIRQTLAPSWNFDCSFGIDNRSKSLKVKMFDHDDFGVDDLMGVAVIDLAAAMQSDILEWVPMLSSSGDAIIGEDGSNSMIRVALKFTLHSSASTDKRLVKPIYGESAGEKDLMNAIRQAAGSNPKKRVLLQLGANWSSACKRMFLCLSQDTRCRGIMEKSYIHILLDAERDINFGILKKLGYPQWLGFPILVVLDYQGKFIHTQATGELETDPILTSELPDPQKVTKFLEFWRDGGENDLGKK
jgi:hypothetical protein